MINPLQYQGIIYRCSLNAVDFKLRPRTQHTSRPYRSFSGRTYNIPPKLRLASSTLKIQKKNNIFPERRAENQRAGVKPITSSLSLSLQPSSKLKLYMHRLCGTHLWSTKIDLPSLYSESGSSAARIYVYIHGWWSGLDPTLRLASACAASHTRACIFSRPRTIITIDTARFV